MKNKTLDLVYIGISAALIAICSWITVPLPGGIPITLQTLGVCLVAAVLGLKRGTLATLTYILIGLIGLPVFSGFGGGPAILFGNTGGYIIGFVFTALIVGAASDMISKRAMKTYAKYIFLALSMVVGIIICYAFGTAWFAVVWARSKEPAALGLILSWCVFPYIIPDLIKIVIAVIISVPLKRNIKK